MKTMKTTSLFLFSLLLTLSFSCFDTEQDDSTVLKPIPTWQEQIKYAKKHNLKSNKKTDDIKLIEYKYKGKIQSESDISTVVDDLFSDNADFALYSSQDTKSHLQIVKVKTILNSVEHDPFAELKSQLKSGIKVGMELVGLKWEYMGTPYYSTAIVSNNDGGVIYDNIGTYLPDPSSTINNSARKNILKTQSESGSGSTSGTGDKYFSKSDSRTNYYGMTVWQYSITCNSYFNNNGVLINRSLSANHNALFGFSCTADIRTISGEIGSSTYHEFAWGCAYGTTVSVSLTWNGSGFTLSGGGTGETGTLVHRR